MKSVYVYYRIHPAQEAVAADRIDALLGVMTEHCTEPPRRLSRCDDSATWMEIYEGIGDYAAFTVALAAAARSLGCVSFTQGERHLECFSPHGDGPARLTDPRG